MNEMTFGQMAAAVGCALVIVVLLIVGIVLFISWFDRAKFWLQKRKMKTYMVQYIVSKITKDGKVMFFEDSIETKYFKSRSPQLAVKKLLDEPYFNANLHVSAFCIRKVVEIQPV